MKKVLVLFLFMCLILCGCTTLQKMSIEDIINEGTHREINIYNKYRKGYKYNVPRGLYVSNNTDYNETLDSLNYKYYLYIDAVSYYNKVIEKYEVNDKAYISMQISYEDKYGYLEVNKLLSGQYLIEIMYNYAKIEVIVDSSDIKEAIANAISILASVSFNDSVLKTLLNEGTSQFSEIEYNIFKTDATTNSEYLQAIDKDVYVEDSIHDTDLIGN